ncbi:MAG: 3-isopropylmalate dehydratase [Methanomassiliicoccales archaeon]|jgi:3-isopropylmalate dehydratase small subunit|nr:3-isopropylmalate dehydratase [Methanomassiliicoccales archaeon]
MQSIRGRVWKFADHIDTDQIIPAERLTSDNIERLGHFIFEKVRPGFASMVKNGDIIVAGRNFGCGSSREHAPRALKQAGISCIIAESFARIFFRNSLNVGLIPIECHVDAEEGDIVNVLLEEGIIIDERSGQKFCFHKYPPFISDLIEAGGLIAKVKERKKCSELR